MVTSTDFGRNSMILLGRRMADAGLTLDIASNENLVGARFLKL
jgi:hypothetical protein